MNSPAMLKQRVLVALVLLPVGIALILWGGLAYLAMVAFFMAIAVWEYAHLFATLGRRPAAGLMVLGVLALVGARYWLGFRGTAPLVVALMLLLLLYHMADYARGAAESGTDFAVSLSGVLYLGLLGAYMISLRQLPGGVWWVLLTLPTIWLADSGAYFIGRAWGRHKLSPRLSPKKTWEGYLGGILTGAAGAALLAWGMVALGKGALPAGLTPSSAAVLGVLLSALAPLGDLAESMFKRQAAQKDSGHLLPGHGGAFDRIDSWLWAGMLAYYFILLVSW